MTLEDSQEIVTKAFHGTLGIYTASIEQNGFTIKSDSNCYLGDGVYFFDNQLAKAKAWARRRQVATPNCNGTAVFQSAIRLGYCLNLSDQAVADVVVRLISAYRQKCNIRITDATAVDLVAEIANIDTVRAIRMPQNARTLFKESHFTADVEVILCVRNLRNILSTKLVWSEKVRKQL